MINNNFPDAKQIVTNGIPVTYYECGEGEPMVLLHGWPQTSYVWRKVIPELSKKYRVIAVDLPGMGNSDAAPAADTQSVAIFLKSFFDLLGLEKYHLLAHDVGAWVAVTFALEFEKSLLSLIILDAGIPGLIPAEIFVPENANKIWQFYFHAIEGMPEFLIEGKEKDYLNWYLTKKATVKDAITEEDMAVYTKAFTGKQRLRDGFAYYRAFPKSSLQNKSYQHRLTIPVIAIGGEQAQGSNIGKAMQKIADSKITTISIPDCGHYIAEERPDALLNIINDFMAVPA